jgi:hypothetical protein
VRRLLLVVALAVGVSLALGYGAVRWWTARARANAPVATAPAAPAAPVRKIRARLSYISEDGMRLVPVDREVPYGATPTEQATALVEALLTEAPAPYKSPISINASVRGVFLTEQGDAFVDLTKEAVTEHTGGSLDELFSVYAIVNTLTGNLPAITRVQILVEGKEVDSLAGHVDLRSPLPASPRWALPPGAPPAPAAPAATPAPATPAPARPPSTVPMTR